MSTIVELIREEQDSSTPHSTPDSELGPQRLARRRLMRGETLVSTEFAREQGCSTSAVNDAAKALEQIGYEVERTPVPRQPGQYGKPKTAVRVTNTGFRPTDEQIQQVTAKRTATERRRKKARIKREREAAGSASQNGSGRSGSKAMVKADPALQARKGLVLPELGQSLTVYAMVLNDDGSVTLGVKGGDHAWLTVVTGVQ